MGDILSGGDISILNDLINAHNALIGIVEKENFQVGFRMGLTFGMDTATADHPCPWNIAENGCQTENSF